VTDKLLIDARDNAVLVLTLNRPEVHNALDFELLDALAGRFLLDGEAAGAVILRGAGDRAFSAGFDLDLLTGGGDDLEADRAVGRAVAAIRRCPSPVLAEVRGHCHGAAVELMLACDLRLAGEDLQLGIRAVELGVVYRYELLARLVQIVGLGRAQDLLLAMPVLDADTALAWGLVTELVPAQGLAHRAEGLAAALAGAPRSAVRGTKASLRRLADRSLHPQDLAEVDQWRTEAARSPERAQALTLAKRRLRKA
jgi:enoyl-CoA hydratase/carnithine racemase